MCETLRKPILSTVLLVVGLLAVGCSKDADPNEQAHLDLTEGGSRLLQGLREIRRLDEALADRQGADAIETAQAKFDVAMELAIPPVAVAACQDNLTLSGTLDRPRLRNACYLVLGDAVNRTDRNALRLAVLAARETDGGFARAMFRYLGRLSSPLAAYGVENLMAVNDSVAVALLEGLDDPEDALRIGAAERSSLRGNADLDDYRRKASEGRFAWKDICEAFFKKYVQEWKSWTDVDSVISAHLAEVDTPERLGMTERLWRLGDTGGLSDIPTLMSYLRYEDDYLRIAAARSILAILRSERPGSSPESSFLLDVDLAELNTWGLSRGYSPVIKGVTEQDLQSEIHSSELAYRASALAARGQLYWADVFSQIHTPGRDNFDKWIDPSDGFADHLRFIYLSRAMAEGHRHGDYALVTELVWQADEALRSMMTSEWWATQQNRLIAQELVSPDRLAGELVHSYSLLGREKDALANALFMIGLLDRSRESVLGACHSMHDSVVARHLLRACLATRFRFAPLINRNRGRAFVRQYTQASRSQLAFLQGLYADMTGSPRVSAGLRRELGSETRRLTYHDELATLHDILALDTPDAVDRIMDLHWKKTRKKDYYGPDLRPDDRSQDISFSAGLQARADAEVAGMTADVQRWLPVLAAQTAVAMGDSARARELYSKALEGNATMLDLLRTQAAGHENDLVGVIFEKTRQALRENWEYHNTLGFAHYFVDHPDSAEHYLKKAIEIVERQRSTLSAELGRSHFMTHRQVPYRNLIRLLIEQDRQREALEWLERSKSRALYELLSARGLSLGNEKDQGLLSTLLEREYVLAASMAARREEHDQAAAAARRVEDAAARVAETKARIARESPRLAQLTSDQEFDLDEVQKHLDEGSILVDFFLTADRLFMFLVDKHGVRTESLPIGFETMVAEVGEIKHTIEQYQRPASVVTSMIEDTQTSRLLSASLGELSAEHLIIVPTGPLHMLPFEALPCADGQLIDEYRISYLPSASVLPILRERKKAGNHALVIGNPITSLPALSYAEREAQAVGSLFSQADVLIGPVATESRLKSGRLDYSVIHMACHGTFDSMNPMRSAVHMSADAENDGRLELTEIFGLEMERCQLVTLSACQTGLAELTEGDERIGFERGFFFAGAQALVTTLWAVDDKTMADLMERFYRGMTEFTAVESLRKSQLSIREQLPHPFYWAGLRLSGNPAPFMN